MEKAHFKIMNKDEQDYLNEGKGCAIWGMILVIVIMIGACMFVYAIANK